MTETIEGAVFVLNVIWPGIIVVLGGFVARAIYDYGFNQGQWHERETPIGAILYCPYCHTKHIDKANLPDWENPPHKSHLCESCGSVWRPADIPTNGVEEIKTKGKHDRLRSNDCTQCPHVVGDAWQRDCAWPDCTSFNDIPPEASPLQELSGYAFYHGRQR